MQGNTVTIGHNMFSEGWRCFKGRPWFWVGIIVLCAIIENVIGTAASIIIELVSPEKPEGDFNWGTFIILMVLSLLVHTRIQIGLVWMGIVTVEGRRARVRDLLAKPRVFWRYLFALLLFQLMIMVGYIFFIVPGIYLTARFLPLSFVLVERETGILESFRQAQRLTEGHRSKLIVLLLLAVAVMLALTVGLMALPAVAQILGPLAVPIMIILFSLLIMLVGLPVVMLSLASLYRAMRNSSADLTTPA